MAGITLKLPESETNQGGLLGGIGVGLTQVCPLLPPPFNTIACAAGWLLGLFGGAKAAHGLALSNVRAARRAANGGKP